VKTSYGKLNQGIFDDLYQYTERSLYMISVSFKL